MFRWTCVVLLLATSAGRAQQTSEDRAAVEKMVSRSFEALKKSDWKAFARMLHSDALADLRAVMATLVEEAAKDPNQEKQVLQLFADASSAKALLELSPEDFCASFLKGVTEKAPQLKQVLVGAEFEIIGTVFEKDGTAHVVIRGKMKVEEAEVNMVQVVSAKRERDSWRMLLKAEMKGMAEQIRRSFKRKA